MPMLSDATLGAIVLILGIVCPVGSIVARWARAPVQPGADPAREVSVVTITTSGAGPSEDELRAAIARLVSLETSLNTLAAFAASDTAPLSEQVLSRMSARAQVLAARDKAAREAAARRATGGTLVSDEPATPGLRPFRRPRRKLVLDCPDFSGKDNA
jgi:hypothetical protein